MEIWVDPKLSVEETESKLMVEKRAHSRFINAVADELAAFVGCLECGKTFQRLDGKGFRIPGFVILVSKPVCSILRTLEVTLGWV